MYSLLTRNICLPMLKFVLMENLFKISSNFSSFSSSSKQYIERVSLFSTCNNGRSNLCSKYLSAISDERWQIRAMIMIQTFKSTF